MSILGPLSNTAEVNEKKGACIAIFLLLFAFSKYLFPLSFWKSLYIYIAAYWYIEMDDKQPLSSADDNLTSNATPSPGLQAVSDRQILSTSQHNVDPNNDPRHLRVSYVKSGVYTCRVCNAVGCTQENVTVSFPGRHFVSKCG